MHDDYFDAVGGLASSQECCERCGNTDLCLSYVYDTEDDGERTCFLYDGEFVSEDAPSCYTCTTGNVHGSSGMDCLVLLLIYD